MSFTGQTALHGSVVSGEADGEFPCAAANLCWTLQWPRCLIPNESGIIVIAVKYEQKKNKHKQNKNGLNLFPSEEKG